MNTRLVVVVCGNVGGRCDGRLLIATAGRPSPRRATLVAGTAKVTINGKDTGTTEAVQCVPAGTLTTITTGDAASGVTAMVSKKDELVAESVSINNLAGFTGSYNRDLGGTAKVTMTGATYDISGTADGFNTDNPSFRTGGTFAIEVAC